MWLDIHYRLKFSPNTCRSLHRNQPKRGGAKTLKHVPQLLPILSPIDILQAVESAGNLILIQRRRAEHALVSRHSFRVTTDDFISPRPKIWVETLLQLLEDSPFALSQRSFGTLAGSVRQSPKRHGGQGSLLQFVNIGREIAGSAGNGSVRLSPRDRTEPN